MQMRRKVRRRRYLSDKDKVIIVALIDEAPLARALSWDEICGRVESAIGYRWTRQALQAISEIKAAYLAHKAKNQRLRVEGGAVKSRPSRHQELEAQVKRLRDENGELHATLDQYDELLGRYIANAINAGISVERLEAPLEPPIRSRTTIVSERKRKVTSRSAQTK
jgi:hypothetical protein